MIEQEFWGYFYKGNSEVRILVLLKTVFDSKIRGWNEPFGGLKRESMQGGALPAK